jgi:uncharacterized membrane protein
LSVEVPLFGRNLQDILVLDRDGISLDWTLTETGIRVDSLGSIEIQIMYTTSSLTNKSGTLWSVSLSSPVNTIYTLPLNAALVGLEPSPLEISLIDNRVTVTMPNATSRISYIIGSTGTRERALVLLNAAEEALNEAKEKGLILTEADALFAQAQEAFENDNYSQSEQLSQKTIDKTREIETEAERAQTRINEANSLIMELEGSVDPADLDLAVSKFGSAAEAYNQGEYGPAFTFADEAYEMASNAQPTRTDYTYLILAVVIVTVSVVGALLFWRRGLVSRTKPEKRIADVDLDRVFEENPSLRTDEKAVLRYIHESGGAYITEVRERFDIPKSTAWRMMNRLEEANLIETRLVGRETYIKIKEK